MWDDADMLNGCAGALYVLAAAALLYAAVHVVVNSPLLPLRHLALQGDVTHITREQAENAARVAAVGTFLSVDLDAVRRAFESLPWVRHVEVRRLWPDRLQVVIEEHVALARWGVDAQARRLINTHGEVFEGELSGAERLPQFIGPGGSAQEVTRHYAAFRETLAPLHLEPRQVLLSPRYAWQLRLSNGLTLELGRDQIKEPVLHRLGRFVAFYAQALGKLNRRLEYVDLRYPNGFALRVPEITHPATEPNTMKPKRGSGEKA
ncbi:MAG: cell division protein FtsQ/DivIB [Burkholderiales bacterium]|nr:cell division protein FtsQ/DivIB [Burkholderiales bacterium]